MHFVGVPYTPVLGKEVKWDSEITGTVKVFDCIKRHQIWQFRYINNCRENAVRKKIKCLFWIPLKNRYIFPLSFRVPSPSRVHWGHARRHGKRSPEMLTFEKADYMQEFDCHYFESWSVDRWSVCRLWLVLICQLDIVLFGIFATFAVPFRFVLSVEHEPEIAGPTAPPTASTRHWQPECFLFREWKQCVVLHFDNRNTADSWKCCTTVHLTDLVSNRFQPTIFWSVVTTFVCTSSSTTFVKASWQPDEWPWWPVVPLFSEGIMSKASPDYIWFQCLRHGAGLQIYVNGNKLIHNWNCPIIKWCVFHIHYQIEKRNKKGILCVKA